MFFHTTTLFYFQSEKNRIIRELRAIGQLPICITMFSGRSEQEAFAREDFFIEVVGIENLTNELPGRCPKLVYDAFDPTERVLLVAFWLFAAYKQHLLSGQESRPLSPLSLSSPTEPSIHEAQSSGRVSLPLSPPSSSSHIEPVIHEGDKKKEDQKRKTDSRPSGGKKLKQLNTNDIFLRKSK